MSISFERNEKWIELQEFSNHEVSEYLASKLNISGSRFKVVAKPNLCNGVMAKFDDVDIIIHAKHTWVELSFNQDDAEKMSEVIQIITKWDKFSKTEKTFYVTIDDDSSRTIIFENGYATCGEYRRHFGNDELKITSFKND